MRKSVYEKVKEVRWGGVTIRENRYQSAREESKINSD